MSIILGINGVSKKAGKQKCKKARDSNSCCLRRFMVVIVHVFSCVELDHGDHNGGVWGVYAALVPGTLDRHDDVCVQNFIFRHWLQNGLFGAHRGPPLVVPNDFSSQRMAPVLNICPPNAMLSGCADPLNILPVYLAALVVREDVVALYLQALVGYAHVLVVIDAANDRTVLWDLVIEQLWVAVCDRVLDMGLFEHAWDEG
ncbi:hypothetical protein GQ54DRAFT_86539 [Martensiomyces pterosporus]|nr:hypothetical protein GQ54DRAFT_86539 [Martensiomyces pterosporus]